MASTRRTIAAGSALLLSAGLLAGGTTTAQAGRLHAPPRVDITITGDGVQMPGHLRSQRYRFVVRTQRPFAQLQLVRPDRGYTKREFLHDSRQADRGDVGAVRRISRNLRFFGGSNARAGHKGVFWETLYRGRYWAFDFASSTQRRSQITTVRVREPYRLNRWPGSNATITTYDYGFEAPRVLPRRGKMLIRNRMGAEPHFVIFARLPRGTSYADVVAYLEHPQGPPPAIEDVLSTPILSNDVQYLQRYRLPRGRYALLCFFPTLRPGAGGAPHAFMGMHAPARVR